MEDRAVGTEARAVTGTVPASVGRVPSHDAAHVAAACGDDMESAGGIAPGRDRLAGEFPDGRLAGLQFIRIERLGPDAVAHQVSRAAHVALEELHATGAHRVPGRVEHRLEGIRPPEDAVRD